MNDSEKKESHRPGHNAPFHYVPDFEDDVPIYTHEPLEHPSNSRILRLLNDTVDKPLRCDIWEISGSRDMTTDPSYYCLSYTWNNQLPNRAISINGKKYLITESLHSALCRLRNDKLDVLLWVDAICIDQSNNVKSLQERGTQVQMLSKLFSESTAVVVDLGDASPGSQYVLECFKKYSAGSQELWDKFELEYYKAPPHNKAAASAIEDLDLPRWDDDFWPEIGEFGKRPWFHRVWVVQEYCLAKSVMFMIGQELYDADFIYTSILRLRMHYEHLCGILLADRDLVIQDLSGFATAQTKELAQATEVMETIRKNVRQHATLELAYLLHVTFTSKFEATDPRDRVYSLLGLRYPKHGVPFLPDYTKDIDSVQRAVTLHLIEQGRGVFALYHSCNYGLPSASTWAFDLMSYAEDTIWSHIRIDETGKSNDYSACGSTQLSTRSGSSELELVVSGILLQTLQQPGPIFRGWQDLLYYDKWVRKYPEIPRHVFWSCLLGRAMNFEDGYDTPLVEDPDHDDPVSNIKIFDERVHHTACSVLGEAEDDVNTHHGKDRTADFDVDRAAPLGFMHNILSGYGTLAVTSDGIPCRAPGHAMLGDHLAIFHGCPIPFLLRPYGKCFRMIGPCYIHGMMDGQAVASGKYTAQDITLI